MMKPMPRLSLSLFQILVMPLLTFLITFYVFMYLSTSIALIIALGVAYTHLQLKGGLSHLYV